MYNNKSLSTTCRTRDDYDVEVSSKCFIYTPALHNVYIWTSDEQTGLGVYLTGSRVREYPFVYGRDVVMFESIFIVADESDILTVGRYRGLGYLAEARSGFHIRAWQPGFCVTAAVNLYRHCVFLLPHTPQQQSRQSVNHVAFRRFSPRGKIFRPLLPLLANKGVQLNLIWIFSWREQT